MEEQPSETGSKPWPSSLKFITRFLAGVFLVPLLVLVLLAWTIVGRLCSLGGRTIFLVLLVLAVIPLIADPDFFGQQGNYMYAFDASLIDPVCVLVATYAFYMCTLRSHEQSAAVAARRRLVALPVSLIVDVFFFVKIAALSRGSTGQWKVAWLWVSLLWSVFAYLSMARWWTDASMRRLELAEAALLNEYGEVEYEQTVVAGLGTVIVKDRAKDGAESGWGTPYQEAGSPKPFLVLVHGYAAGNAFWMFVLEGLSKHFRVVCVEMYGCGRSERLPFSAKNAADTERLLVECLEKWREAMGIEEMVLCGHSLGGMVVAAYAMEHPHRLIKLVLASPAGVGGISPEGDIGGESLKYRIYAFFWNRGVGPLWILRWSGPFGFWMSRFLIAKRLSWVPEMAKIKDVDPDLLGDYIFQLLALPPSGEKLIFPLLDPNLHAYRPMLENLGGSNASRGGGAAGGRGISCPVSIVYGAPSIDWMPRSYGVALAERLRLDGIRAEVYTVPDAGHTLIIDNPDHFTRIFVEAYYDARASHDR
ncbi:unnamed protein product [Ascophyllum nodosum]